MTQVLIKMQDHTKSILANTNNPKLVARRLVVFKFVGSSNPSSLISLLAQPSTGELMGYEVISVLESYEEDDTQVTHTLQINNDGTILLRDTSSTPPFRGLYVYDPHFFEQE